jgi:hypothetical protein
MIILSKIRKMQQTLDITRTSRTIVSQMLAGYTLDQLNTIQKDTVIIWEYCSYHRRAADVSL